MKPWKWVAIGSVILVMLPGLCCVGSIFGLHMAATTREPELPVQHLLDRQLEALPAGWSLAATEVVTDTDLTWAAWGVYTGFRPPAIITVHGASWEELHIYQSVIHARIFSDPSPSSVDAGKGYTPEGWTYHPPHAAEFEFGCRESEWNSSQSLCSCRLRYAEYVLILSVRIGDAVDAVTLADLERLLSVTDQEMALFLATSEVRRGFRTVPKGGLP